MAAKQYKAFHRAGLQLTLVTTVLYYLLYFLADRTGTPLFQDFTLWPALLDLALALVECFVFVNLSLLYNKLLLRTLILRKRTFPRLLAHNLLLLLPNLGTAYLFSQFILLAWHDEREFFSQNLYVYSIIVTFVSGLYTNYWLMQEANEAELHRKEAEIRALKAQIDPHFMFNNFSILSELIEEDPKIATHFLGQLSNVYRYVIGNARKDLVPLGEEVTFLTSYIYLLKIRYEDDVQISIDPVLRNASGSLPPVCLQLLVENAIKHNERPLHIEIRQEGENIVVENGYRPLKNEPPSTGKGTKIITGRYALLTDRKPVHEQKNDKYIVMLPLINSPFREVEGC